MKNPFESIDKRLRNIEGLLLDLTNNPKNESHPISDGPIGIKEVAKITGKSVQTIYGYCQRKEIPYSKKGNHLYFFKPQIIEWIKTGKQKTVLEIEKDTDSFLSKRKISKF